MKKRLKKKYHRVKYDAKEARKKALQRQMEAIKEIQEIDWGAVTEKLTIAFRNLAAAVEALAQAISFRIKALSDDDFSNLMAQLPHGEQKAAWKIRNTESEDKR